MNSPIFKKTTTILLPLILLVAGLYLVPIQIFEKDFSKVPGDYGDARFNNYILEHGYKYMTGQESKYWDAPFMYPYKNVIALSDNLLGTVPIYSLFRIFHYDRETSYQLWLLTMFALNFICCWWVLKRWSGDNILSSTGAYIFAFSIFILGHIYNVQTFPRFIVPFVFYWSWKYLTEKKIRYFILLLLGIVYQFYCGIYLGFFLLYALMFFLLSYFIINRDVSLIKQFWNFKITATHLLVIVVSIGLMIPLMQPYIDISKKLGMRNFEDTLGSIPHFRSYFFTSEAPMLWSFLSKHGQKVFPQWWCHHLFMGALPWLGIAALPVVLFSSKTSSSEKKFLAFLFIGLLLTFVFALSTHGYTLYKIIFRIPGFSSMRAINRVINTEVVYFILIFVFVFRELTKRDETMKWLLFALPLLIIVDNLIDAQKVMRYDKKESQNKIAIVKDNIRKQSDGSPSVAIAYMPFKADNVNYETNLNVMLAAQELNIPCVNAYTGSLPSPFIDFNGNADEKSLLKWCSFNNINRKTIQTVNDIGLKESGRKVVHLKAMNGKFLSADKNLGNTIIANRDNGWDWETFILINLEDNKCVIRAYNNLFLSAELGADKKITASRDHVKEWETFSMVALGGDVIALKASNEKYLSIDQETLRVFAKSDSIGSQERLIMEGE